MKRPYPSIRRTTPESKVRNAIDSQDYEAFTWAMIDLAFLRVKQNPESRNWHLLLKEMSSLVIKAKAATVSSQDNSDKTDSVIAFKQALEEMGLGSAE